MRKKRMERIKTKGRMKRKTVNMMQMWTRKSRQKSHSSELTRGV